MGRPALAAIARTALFARLTGSPTEQAPWYTATPGFRGKLAQFRSHTTALLREQLDTVAAEFLADRHITEPVLWSPPAALLADLPLPGLNPDTVDIGLLHQMLKRPGSTLTATARQLKIGTQALRHLTDIYPCPLGPKTPQPKQLRRIPGLTAAAWAARSERGHTLNDLARDHNLSRQTVTRIAATLGVPTRSAPAPCPPRCSKHWLEQRYLVERHTMAEVAAAAGVSPSTVARWFRHYRITARPRGATSHRRVTAARRNATTQPALLQPALRDPFGWNRLQRLAAAMQHPTLRAAAHHLNTSQPVLSQQLTRLEQQLGRTLYHRAQRGQPMQPTRFGRQVMSALATMAPDADPVAAPGTATTNSARR